MLDRDSDGQRLASLRRAADRVSTNRSFMAYLLARWGEIKGLSWSEAAERIGCTDDTIHRLAFCRRPDPSADRFADNVEHIAYYARIDPGVLARLVRQVDAIQALRETRPLRDASAAEARILMAALDRLEDEPLNDSSDDDGA